MLGRICFCRQQLHRSIIQATQDRCRKFVLCCRSVCLSSSNLLLVYDQAVKIYTKTGDQGQTGLFGGARVLKSDIRVAAYGDVDELNAALGVVVAMGVDPEITDVIGKIQGNLMALGARLADPGRGLVSDKLPKLVLGQPDVDYLEQWIDHFEEGLPKLTRFILPGGTASGAVLHLARTVCRRAERRIVSLGPDGLEPVLLAYINRLSDLLFVLARAVNARNGVPEVEW